ANWPAFQKILNDRAFKDDPPYSEKDLKEMMGSVAIHDRETLLQRNKAGGGLEKYFQALHQFLKENGMLKKDFAIGDIYNNQLFLESLK
ncbi:MAG: hypothetical protein GY859_42295, partial [Desulfobacterales bacterium]|nr:hypothetical protein [Desulfobacterales bacterium]